MDLKDKELYLLGAVKSAQEMLSAWRQWRQETEKGPQNEAHVRYIAGMQYYMIFFEGFLRGLFPDHKLPDELSRQTADLANRLRNIETVGEEFLKNLEETTIQLKERAA